MFQVIRYTNYGFTSYVMFASYSKWAAVAVFNNAGDDVDFEKGFLLIDDHNNHYDCYGQCIFRAE